MTALAESKARELHRTYCITGPEDLADLEAIANAECIIIEEAYLANCQGKIRYEQDCGLIKISSAIREPGARRFVIAHEMGHFFSESSRLNNCSSRYLTPVRSNPQNENNANAFAVEFLMRREWYEAFVKDKDPGIDTIREAAEYFAVSLSAAAIRYAQAGNFPIAAIMAHRGRVSWSAISESFPYQFIGKSCQVNGSSEAYAFFRGEEVDTSPHTVLADSWFLNDRNFRRCHFLTEQCLPMPNYKSILTVLWEEPIK